MSEERKEKKEISVDLSKIDIANIDAMINENPSIKDFSEKYLENKKPSSVIKEEVVTENLLKGYVPEVFKKYPRKFDFVQPSIIELPSKGKFYQNIDDENIRKGFIEIYPMTMKEEEILSTNRYIVDGTATIMALNNCIKSNISAMDLLVPDFYYLLLYLRKISISDKFLFNISCDKCGHTFRHEINISEIEFGDEVEEDFKEPIRVDLPVSGYTVILGMPRIRSIRELSYIINNSDSEIGLAEYLYTITLAIITKNGEELPKEDWVVFFNNLPHKDSDALNKKSTFKNGLQHIIKEARCPECGTEVEGSSVDLNNNALFLFQ